MTEQRERPAERTAGPPTWLLRLMSLTTYVGIAGFVVAEVVQIAQNGTAGLLTATFLNALVWVVGVNAIIVASGHIFFADPVADSIGWGRGSPFQYEVGLANLGIGVLGVLAPSFDRGFQLAAVITFTVFYLGAAVGHVREMVVEGNTSPGNAGFILWFDIVAPLAVIALYVAS
jgi:hypothetical protein